jgi:hypothetical protein
MPLHEETAVSSAAPVGPSKSAAVTIVGLITFLWGAAHVVLGGSFIFVGDAIWKDFGPDGDPARAGGLAPLFWMLAGLMIVIGGGFLLLGVPGIVAGLGILWHKQWGRVLAMILAVVSIMVGLLSLSACKQDGAGNATLIAFGAAEILYGILALVVLIRNRTAFTRRRRPK